MPPRRSLSMPSPTDKTAQRPRRGAGLLGLWVVFWLLTQTLGQAHGVLHARLAPAPMRTSVVLSPAAAPAVALRSAERSFHPQPDGGPAHDSGGLCRLYGQLAQGDLAPGAAFFVALPCSGEAPGPVAAFASAGVPRVALHARGPPAVG